MIDGRTMEGVRGDIRKFINEHKGFSCFWATANRKRAKALTEMIASGEIVSEPKQYPWTKAIVMKKF